MAVSFSDFPLTVVGWSADEAYIHENIQAIKQQDTLASSTNRLSIIDPYWQPTLPSIGNKNHNRLASAFQVQQVDCHFPTKVNGQPSTDNLFQWLQTRYSLGRMRTFVVSHRLLWQGS